MPHNQYGQLTGSGTAAAHAAAIIAMVLEWAVVRGRHETISGADINRLLIRGADRFIPMEYPNPTSGYGYLDIYGMFEKLI